MKAIKQAIKRSSFGPTIMRLRTTLQLSQDQNALYDRQAVNVMRKILKPDSVCIDVGAHEGSILTWMCHFAPSAQHYAFEPIPSLAQGLRRNFPNAIVQECALSDECGESTFEYVLNEPAYSGLRRRVYDCAEPIVEQLTVPVLTLDSIIPSTTKIDLLKIDVEGGEYHVMRGGVETIRRSQPILIFEAGAKSTGQYGVTSDDVFDFITRDLGMKLSTMHRWLNQKASLDRIEFSDNWIGGPDYYFIAH